MIMVLLAVFMLISNADASAWDIYGTVVNAPEDTVVSVWKVDCGVEAHIGHIIPDEDGYYELTSVGKGVYLVRPFNGGATFKPEMIKKNVPENKPIDFVVVE